jgi:oligopeptide transport system substrate-binding protein
MTTGTVARTLGLLAAVLALGLLWLALCVGGAWVVLDRLGDATTARGGASTRVQPSGPDGADPGVPQTRDAPSAPDETPGAAVSGGELRLPGDEPTTLDPTLVGDVVSAEYLYEVYSGLVTLSPELAVIPDLAESWTIDPAGTVYTFTLRSGATFHDGTAVTADAFAFAIERACDPAVDSPVAATYLGDVVGCTDKLAGRSASVAGARAVDERHLVLAIDAAKAYFLAKLTYPTAFALDRRQVTGDPSWATHPNGTGPFRLTRYEEGEALVLERFDGYFGTRAHLDRVTFDLRPIDPLTRYENGELDASPVGSADLERVRDPLNPLSGEVVTGGELGLTYIAFNVRRAPFDDVHVRRAFNRALDKQRLTEVVLRGAVEPIDTILPPGMPGHDPALASLRFDPDAARAELAASRYGGPRGFPPVTLDVSGDGGGSMAAEAVADFLSTTLAVSVTVEATPWQTYQGELQAGAYDMFMLGWAADYPDPQDFLDVLFHGASPLNHTGYAEPEVDAALEAARVEADGAARLALYRRAEQRVLADAVWLPLYTTVDVWLVARTVHGFRVPAIVMPRLAQVWVQPR